MRSLFNRDPASASAAPAAEAVAAGGWDGMRGSTKLVLGVVVVGGLIAAVVLPGLGQRQVAQLQNQDARPPSRISEYEPPASRDFLQTAANNLGVGVLAGTPTPPVRRRPAATAMALYATPVQSSAAAAGVHAIPGEGLSGEPGAAAAVGSGRADPNDRLAAQLTGATMLPASTAILTRNRSFIIEAGEAIPCLPIDAQDSSRSGFTSCRVPEWYRSSDQRRGLLPPGTRIFGQIRTGVARGEMRLGVLYTLIQTPRFKVKLAAPGADAMGRAGLDGDLHTFFWDRAGSVALFALMDAAIGTGQNLASSALSRSFSGSNGTTLNLGSQAQGLASQEQASALNRQPVLTRDQALPITVTVGQELDFTGVCKEAMQIDPMACPLL